jgi:AraC-like DNA-binding protein
VLDHRDSAKLIDMQQTLSRGRNGRLEGLCEQPAQGARGAGISIGSGCNGIERLEARFRGRAFSPHRHDTYAIGITLSGVQTFRYRGRQWHCLPGQCHILHPDELHDGASGTDDGFSYRIVYIDPAIIQQALGGRPLPFVATPVGALTRCQTVRLSAAWDMESEIDDVGWADIAAEFADLLVAASTGGSSPTTALRHQALLRVRDLIATHPARRHPIDEIERIAGLDRWSLARQFRSAFGTSPSRFRTMRQLDQVRRLVRAGSSLVEAALAAGFADQSHMSRQFKRAYGLTPAEWATALGAALVTCTPARP